MKSYTFAVLAGLVVLLEGCATIGQQQQQQGRVLGPVPTQQTQPATKQEVAPSLFQCNGRWQEGQCGTGTVVPVGSILNTANGIGKCKVVGGLGGAGLGALAGGENHRLLGAGIGAVVGVIAGDMYCENSAGQPVGQQQPAKMEATFSNEGTGAGACRLLSDGSARLKSTPAQTVARGQVLAISEGPGAVPKLDGEDCNAWRRRTASSLLYQG